MLENLMMLTMNGWIAEDAIHTVEQIYGVEALTAVEAALASDPGDGPRARLQRLHARLSRQAARES